MRRTFAFAAAVAAGTCTLAVGPRAAAEVPFWPPAVLEKSATHVVVGKVKAVYSRLTTSTNSRNEKFVAEIEVEAVEKGEGIAKGSLTYVRYWTYEWLGKPSDQPTGSNGHSGLPREGDRVRVYLRQDLGTKGYPGDGGLDVIVRNGFAPAPPPVPAAGAAPAPTPAR
jgi:hypothetical protein